ncbi:MAG: ribonucleotide-diphosphate reductase subunit beta, partial [Nitrosopumilaceae archaeon]
MHSVILTELGIAIFENDLCKKSFPFSNPVRDYLSIKNRSSEIRELVEFLSNLQTVMVVSDDSLLFILKKKSIDAQLMDEDKINNIQISKTKILVES